MAITELDGFVDADTQKTLRIATEQTHNCPSNVGRHARTHFEAIVDDKNVSNANSRRGVYFQYCFLDAIIKRGIPKSHIVYEKRFNEVYKARVDFLIRPRTHRGRYVLWFLQTSLRERYKIPDYDAEVAPMMFIKPIVSYLFYKEKEKHDMAEVLRSVEKAKSAFRHIEQKNIVSVFSESRVEYLVKEMLKQ